MVNEKMSLLKRSLVTCHLPEQCRHCQMGGQSAHCSKNPQQPLEELWLRMADLKLTLLLDNCIFLWQNCFFCDIQVNRNAKSSQKQLIRLVSMWKKRPSPSLGKIFGIYHFMNVSDILQINIIFEFLLLFQVPACLFIQLGVHLPFSFLYMGQKPCKL